MINFTIEPQCKKCGSIETTKQHCTWAPMNSKYPGDFLGITCSGCGYRFKMLTRDHMEEEND